MQRGRVLFLGTGELGCPALERLARAEFVDLVGVVTQPERPRGRHLRLEPGPILTLARRLGLPVLTPERVGSPESLESIRRLQPDVLVVAAYGQFLPKPLLDLPPCGAVNIHPSLLPRYRGAAPVPWAIARGERETGVTLFYLNERMDAGDIIAMVREPILEQDTSVTLGERLARLGADLLMEYLPAILAGTAPRQPQDEAAATYAPKLKKEDGRMDWHRPARELCSRIRAFQPWPGAFFVWPRRHLLVHVREAAVDEGEGRPGTVLRISGAGPVVACGEGALRLLTVQPEGRRPMPGHAFVAGYRLEPGEPLSDSDPGESCSGTNRR